MTARDTIAGTLRADPFVMPPDVERLADALLTSIRGMPHDELAELRPDIAVEFYVLREQAAQRGHYLLTTLRAHHAEQENQP